MEHSKQEACTSIVSMTSIPAGKDSSAPISPDTSDSKDLKSTLVDEDSLTLFERKEVKWYKKNKHVYFTGLPWKDKVHAPVGWESGPPYDHKDGCYDVRKGDHIAYRYEIKKELGAGSFASGLLCRDWKHSGEEVVIKLLRHVPAISPLLKREGEVLEYLGRTDRHGRENVVHFRKQFRFRGHICFVFERLRYTAMQILERHGFRGLSMLDVRKIACHLLKAMEYLSVLGVVHADLKPENVMFAEEGRSRVKLIDFGWAHIENADMKMLSDYFQSRHYRAPEVILKGSITPALDMWSFGCVIAELACGVPIFQGESRSDQLTVITEVLGFPPEDFLKTCKTRTKYFNTDPLPLPFYCKRWESTVLTEHLGRSRTIRAIGGRSPNHNKVRGPPGSKHIRAALKEKGKPFDDAFIDFLMRCLTWCPEQRMTPSEAIYHTWMHETFESIYPH